MAEKTAFLVETVGVLGKDTICVVDRRTRNGTLNLLSRDPKFKVKDGFVLWKGNKVCLLEAIVIKK